MTNNKSATGRVQRKVRGRSVAVVALVLGVLASVLLPAARAAAATSTVTIVGTSDVNDSGLVPDLIKPMFQAAYPQYTLNYVSLGTGAAISYAEAGSASGLIVHAASLENQFVANGYSAEPFGRAVFYGDYVLLGPASDPAGVLKNATNNIAQAYEDIAAAGAAGKADFVSRANTSGTAVQEHAIWGLTSGVTLCPVSTANGGGEAPTSSAGGTACPSSPSYPSWYHATGLTQGPNIEAANTCNFTNATNNGGNDCYVFTDRGTFDCLMSSACNGGAGAPSNLQIVTSDNSAAAPGGADELINSFHAYAVNPAKFSGNPNVTINSAGAEAFLDFLTSPSFQAQLKGYLAPQSPFVADASPILTAGGLPGYDLADRTIVVRGTLHNAVPGTPELIGRKITVSEVVPGLAGGIPVASTWANATGGYTLRFKPIGTGYYQLSTNQLTQVENASLNPIFADILQPATTQAVRIRVRSVVTSVSAQTVGGTTLVTGSVAPGTSHARGTVYVAGAPAGSSHDVRLAAHRILSGATNFGLELHLTPGTWHLLVRFADPGRVLGSAVVPVTAVVGPPVPPAAAFGRITVRLGRATVRATLAPATTSTTVDLLGLDTRSGSSTLRVLASRVVPAGTTAVTFRVRLARGARWLLALEQVVAAPATSSIGGLRGLNVG